MSFRAVALPAVFVLALVAAPSSSAAVGNDILDPKGDALGGQAAYDIVGVDVNMTMTTSTTVTTVAGKKRIVTTTKPRDLVVSVELAGAPILQPGISYQFGAETDCGHLYAFTRQIAGSKPESSFFFTYCGEPTSTDGAGNFFVPSVVTVSGKKVIFTVPARTLPRVITAKSIFVDLLAYTAFSEPERGLGTVDFVPESAIDYAVGKSARLG